MNAGALAVDRQAAVAPDAVALRFVAPDGAVEETTYAALRDETNRFAHVLHGLGVRRGDVVATLLGREPAVFTAVLGALKAGTVATPLFAAFGPDPALDRLRIARVKVLVTTSTQYARKVAPCRAALPGLDHVLLTDGDLPGRLAAARADFPVARTSDGDPATIHFTSGTTGTPKGAWHTHGSVVAHESTAREVLGLRPRDVYWCTADPGWVTGTAYGILGPLCCGATVVVDRDDFTAARAYRVLARQRVAVWYTSPTALRMLMRRGSSYAAAFDLDALRVVASVGEPLVADVVRWVSGTLGTPVRDTWWQTETGGIMLAAVGDVPPGSMGRPLPGVVAEVLDGDLRPCDPGEPGQLALRPGWPSLFRGYVGEPERYARCFANGWYLTGDVVRRDADGWYWFVARGDDVIKAAGHLVGPAEVEAALAGHPAVDDVAVTGEPDAVSGQVVSAYVVVADPYEATDALRAELLGLGRSRLGPTIAPRRVTFVDRIPRTPSGKAIRRLLSREPAATASRTPSSGST